MVTVTFTEHLLCTWLCSVLHITSHSTQMKRELLSLPFWKGGH